tara:strand:- start:7891 stop:8136 length:246 start_codon:yes stop_codon:yes gene_type:complete
MNVTAPDLLKSKKFAAAALASGLSYLGVQQGFDVQQIALFTAPLYAYIGGQALADVGKSKAKIEAEPATVVTIQNTANPQP